MIPLAVVLLISETGGVSGKGVVCFGLVLTLLTPWLGLRIDPLGLSVWCEG